MYAVEFQTNVENGHIEIPAEFREQVSGYVRVIVLAEEQHSQSDFLAQLLANPIKLDQFTPFSREEIYERQ